MSLVEARAAELGKYVRAYTRPGYHMSGARMADAQRDLRALPCRGSYLDVGCGRGEMLEFARSIGFATVCGTETVPDLLDGSSIVHGLAHQLPFADGQFEVVSLFDVIEHLVPGDDEAACGELRRVASKHILLTANNKSSRQPNGDELHVNRRPYPEWDALFQQWFAGAKVTWLKGRDYVSEGWKVDL